MGSRKEKGEKEESPEEGGAKDPPMKYPVGAFFILFGYLLERFVYYGLFGAVVFYMQRVLAFSASTSSMIKAVMEGLIYLAPIPGAILADAYLGKFRTICIMYCSYVVGCLVFTLSSISPMMATISGKQAAGIGGIFILGMSAGLMKAVYSSLGPDQFKLPEQRRQQQRFFYGYYWMINAGAFAGQFLTAQLRESVQCFGDDCYMLPFLILSGSIVISSLVFYSGKKFYTESPPDTTLIKTIQCIFYSAKKSIISRGKPVVHWIDRSADKFDASLIVDVKLTLRVLLLFTTFPFFWALFFQTSTGMIFQSKRLYDRIGSYRIPPELTSSVNALLVLALIPLFEFVLYPLFDKKGILKTTTSRMATGMGLGCLSFVIYGIINIQVEQSLLGTKQAQLNIYNARDCTVKVSSSWLPENFEISPGSEYKYERINIENSTVIHSLTYQCGLETDQTTLQLQEMNETTVVLFPNQVVNLEPTHHYLKDKDAEAKVRIITDPFDTYDFLQSYFTLRYGELTVAISVSEGSSDFKILSPQNYTLEYDNKTIGFVDVRQDGIYDCVVSKGKLKLFKMVEPTTLHVMTLMPQYIFLTTGEVLFSVSSLDFAYTEAPTSMKSVLQACNLFTITVGLWMFAIFTRISADTHMFDYRASNEAFTYAIGMAVNTVIFILLARAYLKEKEKKKSKTEETVNCGTENPAFQDECKMEEIKN